ncbi:MAG: hypothetical protein EPN82_01025 [Bacteroidetes bacterium]|nr:MAG: hypothetical protein EPN82_01025 [Bacteroidota bacterium]
MSLKLFGIIIILGSFSIITSCNPDTCYLDDCSDKEKMKVSLLNVFGHHILEEYRYVDSLDWYFSESDSVYDVEFFLKKEIVKRKNIIQDGFHIIILKKNCKATYYEYKYRYRDGKYERY